MRTNRFQSMLSFCRGGIVALLACGTASGQICSEGCSEARSALRLSPRHATLSVADLEVEKRWYIKTLGFEELPVAQPVRANGRIKGTELQIPGYQLHLIQFEGSSRANKPNPPFLAQGWVHVAFSVIHIARAAAFLKALGCDVQEVRGKRGTVDTLVLHDPEGNEIELFSRSRNLPAR